MMSKNIQIRDIVAEPGTKKLGFIKVGETATSVVEIPVGIINGPEPGPTLLITAGTHPCEYPGIEAALRTYQQTDPEKIKGTLIVVPVINTPGFQARSAFVCPIDGINIGRAYPGDPNRSISYRIAHVIMEEISSMSDHWFDLHGGDVPERVMPGGYTIFSRDEDEDIARAFGTKYVSKRVRIGGGRRAGRAIVAESGGLATCLESDIKVHKDGVENVMKYLKMMEGAPKIPSDQKMLDKGTFEIYVNHGGIFYPKVQAGDKVKKAQILGEIRNFRGEVLEEIVSPEDGLIRIWLPGYVKNAGDRVYGGYIL